MRQNSKIISQATANPSLQFEDGNGNGKTAASRRYFTAVDDGNDWPPELTTYNKQFTNTLEKIKRRHDGVVTTVGKLCSWRPTARLAR